MSFRLVLLLCVWPIAGCGEACPGFAIEVREHVGPDIEGTSIVCSGDGVAQWPPCVATTTSAVLPEYAETDCEGVGIRLGDDRFGGQITVLWLVGDSEVERARVRSVVYCDDEPCEQEPVAVEGFVAVQELSTTGRNRGAFELEFSGGVISGTYDATVP